MMSTFQPDEWKDKPLVVAVTRAVRQKASILLEALDGSSSVLDELLKRDIYLVVLGTGELENQLEEINRWPNGLFVCAFDPKFANLLYAGGDIFLMPSDLALRHHPDDRDAVWMSAVGSRCGRPV